MKVTFEVVCSVESLEPPFEPTYEEGAVVAESVRQGVLEALKTAENRGFNHPESDWIGIFVEDVTVRWIE